MRASTRTSPSCSACRASTTRPSCRGRADLPADNAAANVDYVRSMVKLEPKSSPTTASLPAPALKGSNATADAEKPSPWAPQVVAKAAR